MIKYCDVKMTAYVSCLCIFAGSEMSTDRVNTAASWKWYTVMDEAIGGRPSITPHALFASCGPDVAVASSSSVRPARARKRPQNVEDLIMEMEERERVESS